MPDPFDPGDRKPDAVLLHQSLLGRSAPNDSVALRTKIQDVGESLMGITPSHPPKVCFSLEAREWYFVRPRLNERGLEQHTLHFPAGHEMDTPETKSRYVWVQKDDNVLLGFLKPEAIELHQANLTAHLDRSKPPVPIG